MPYSDEDDGTNQCSHQVDGRGGIDFDIGETRDNDHVGHQPDADQRSDNSADEAEGQAPANNKLCQQTNDGRNYQVNNKIEAKIPDVVSNFNGNAISQYQT
jgi:hypothetical protein